MATQPARPVGADGPVIDMPDWAREDPELEDLFRSFVTRLPDRAETMEAFLARGDLRGLQAEAHQLKGTAGAYGFPHISQAAAALEQTVKASVALDTVREHVREVATLCRRAGYAE